MGIMVVKTFAADKRFGWQALQERRAVITTMKIFCDPRRPYSVSYKHII